MEGEAAGRELGRMPIVQQPAGQQAEKMRKEAACRYTGRARSGAGAESCLQRKYSHARAAEGIGMYMMLCC